MNNIGNKAAWALLLMWLFPCFVFAAPARARVKTVTGECTYHAGFDLSVNQAKQKATEAAQVAAIAQAFGTIVTKTTASHASSTQSGENFSSSTTVTTHGMADVRGEWLETTKEPEYQVRYDDEFGLIVDVKIEGKIRERVTAEIDLKVCVLRNGLTVQHKDEEFFDGDLFYLLFQAPVNGYLVVYLADSENAYCLLPYQHQAESAMSIKKNQEYVFFSEKTATETVKGIVDEYNLTCGKTVEFNSIYVIFSPNEFTKALDDSGDGQVPRNLSLSDFEKWLGKARSHDAQMAYQIISVKVQPRD